MRGGYFVTFEDKKSSDRNYYDEYVVEEGEEFEFTADQTGFATPIEKIKKVVLFDSVRKKYTGYLYKGEFRNMLVAKALLLRDKWLK